MCLRIQKRDVMYDNRRARKALGQVQQYLKPLA